MLARAAGTRGLVTNVNVAKPLRERGGGGGGYPGAGADLSRVPRAPAMLAPRNPREVIPVTLNQVQLLSRCQANRYRRIGLTRFRRPRGLTFAYH
jgi:hypothetical protein